MVFPPCSSTRLHYFQEKIQMGMQKMKFNDMLYPLALYDEISSSTMSL
jgi:hypothetical protein